MMTPADISRLEIVNQQSCVSQLEAYPFNRIIIKPIKTRSGGHYKLRIFRPIVEYAGIKLTKKCCMQ
jgi:hypothetical protein